MWGRQGGLTPAEIQRKCGDFIVQLILDGPKQYDKYSIGTLSFTDLHVFNPSQCPLKGLITQAAPTQEIHGFDPEKDAKAKECRKGTTKGIGTGCSSGGKVFDSSSGRNTLI